VPAGKFLAPTSPEDPYNKHFRTALAIMEKNGAEREKAGISRQKTGQDSRMQKSRQRYIIGALYEKIAVRLKYILPGRFFRWILEKKL